MVPTLGRVPHWDREHSRNGAHLHRLYFSALQAPLQQWVTDSAADLRRHRGEHLHHHEHGIRLDRDLTQPIRLIRGLPTIGTWSIQATRSIYRTGPVGAHHRRALCSIPTHSQARARRRVEEPLQVNTTRQLSEPPPRGARQVHPAPGPGR